MAKNAMCWKARLLKIRLVLLWQIDQGDMTSAANQYTCDGSSIVSLKKPEKFVCYELADL